MRTWQPALAILFCHFLTGTASVCTRYLVSVLDPVDIAFLRYFLDSHALLPWHWRYIRNAVIARG